MAILHVGFSIVNVASDIADKPSDVRSSRYAAILQSQVSDSAPELSQEANTTSVLVYREVADGMSISVKHTVKNRVGVAQAVSNSRKIIQT